MKNRERKEQYLPEKSCEASVVERKKLNMCLTVLKRATPINWTSVTDWQMTVLWDNVISIMPYQIY